MALDIHELNKQLIIFKILNYSKFEIKYIISLVF